MAAKTDKLGAKLRVRLWNRVPVQLGVGVLLATWTALALGFLWFDRMQDRLLAEQRTRAAMRESSVIVSRFAQEMLAGGGQQAWNAISAAAVQYRDITGAANIRVFTGAGVVKAASDIDAIGTRMDVNANPDCPRCDSTRPTDFPAFATVTAPDGRRWLRAVTAIPVFPACMGCHERMESARSFVATDYELGPLERETAQRREHRLVMALAAGVLVMAVTELLFRLLVMRSVSAIARSADRLAAGNLAARAQVVGGNELALLARDFNYMAERIEEQVARIEAAHTESDLLYTLVVEASKNLEIGDVAVGVAGVLLQKLRPAYVAFFLETADGGWTCAAGGTSGDERIACGEDTLAEALGARAAQLQPLLDGVPVHLVVDACRLQKLQLTSGAGGLNFALPVIAETRMVGLLACIGIPPQIRAGETLLENLGAHLTLAATNSRNYTGAITDGLTRLKNRRYGLMRLEEAVSAARRYKSGIGLLMCGIDNLKPVNETYGRHAGNVVLKEVARRIAACVRKADIPVRYCGDEFMLMLPQTDAIHLEAIGDKVRKSVSAAPISLGNAGVLLPIMISVGLAAFRPDTDSGDTLIARAEAALHRAKQGGGDRVESDA